MVRWPRLRLFLAPVLLNPSGQNLLLRWSSGDLLLPIVNLSLEPLGPVGTETLGGCDQELSCYSSHSLAFVLREQFELGSQGRNSFLAGFRDDFWTSIVDRIVGSWRCLL